MTKVNLDLFMMKFLIVIPLCYLLHLAHGGEPVVNCTAPRSPEHGQAFLYQAGKVVKYVCEPGYVLLGKELVRCVDGKWEDELVTCLKMDDGSTLENFPRDVPKLEAPISPPRPLFNWEEEDNDAEKSEQNSTSDDDEVPMSDEARLRMVLYPRRRARIVTTRIRPARIHSASELEEEEKKRTDAKTVEKTATTIHLEAPPSSIYVRRTISPGKSESQEQTLNQQYRAASVHMTVDNAEDADHVQVVTLPRAAVAQNDKGEDALRQMYWWAHHNYPRQASLVEYRSGNPVVMTLSESQIAWINSLHPELRDQYLRDLYVIRAEEAVEGARAQAFLRRYEDAYNLYHAPYYLRQPVSVIARDPISIYDYSCNQAGSHFVTAPKLPNAHIARYDRRQNPNSPRNHYLSAVYRCNPGYEMLDTRFTELYCSQRRWIGTEPICIPRS